MFNWWKVKFVRFPETSGRSHYLMWDCHPDLILLECISCRKVLLRLSCILLSLTEGWLSVWPCLGTAGIGVYPQCRARRIPVSALLRVLKKKTNVFWLRTLEGGSTEYSGFSDINTERKDSTLTLTLLSPQLPLERVSTARTRSNCNTEHNKATARNVRC